MNKERIRGLLGLAIRSRQAVLGADACRIMIRSGHCGVLLVDASAGPNTRKKAADRCERSGTPMITLPEAAIEEATGNANMVMAIRKGSFAETIVSESAEDA